MLIAIIQQVCWVVVFIISETMPPKSKRAATKSSTGSKRMSARTTVDPTTIAVQNPAELTLAADVRELQKGLKELQETVLAVLPRGQPEDRSLPPGLPSTSDAPGNSVQPTDLPSPLPFTENAFMSSGVTLDLGVGDKLRNDIVSGKYVSLASMIKESSSGVIAKLDQASGQVTFEMGGKNLELDNFEQWLQAFLVYSSVYLKAFPQQSPDMLKYMSSVMQLKQQGGQWRMYDEMFRKRRAQLKFSWSCFDTELYCLAKRPSIAEQPFRATNAGKKGYCYRFQNGAPCKGNCKYLHKCDQCNNDSHGRDACRNGNIRLGQE